MDQFGSFFFVLEAKGIKALTKEIISDEETVQNTMERVLGNLKEELHSLDINYMSNRTYGELFMDLGITYHPKSNNSPLVGLWRLDNLEASYGAGGYVLGNIHHHNTLSHYGGLQAEMSRRHADQVHVIFRSTYNLAYEATRRTNNSRDMFQDADVFNLSEQYLKASHSLIKILKETAPKKSYGVRDEFRVGFSAIPDLAKHLADLVSCFLMILTVI